jgi:hypothetical protein
VSESIQNKAIQPSHRQHCRGKHFFFTSSEGNTTLLKKTKQKTNKKDSMGEGVVAKQK